jgi:hypothetical protein
MRRRGSGVGRRRTRHSAPLDGRWSRRSRARPPVFGSMADSFRRHETGRVLVAADKTGAPATSSPGRLRQPRRATRHLERRYSRRVVRLPATHQQKQKFRPRHAVSAIGRQQPRPTGQPGTAAAPLANSSPTILGDPSTHARQKSRPAARRRSRHVDLWAPRSGPCCRTPGHSSRRHLGVEVDPDAGRLAPRSTIRTTGETISATSPATSGPSKLSRSRVFRVDTRWSSRRG